MYSARYKLRFRAWIVVNTFGKWTESTNATVFSGTSMLCASVTWKSEELPPAFRKRESRYNLRGGPIYIILQT